MCQQRMAEGFVLSVDAAAEKICRRMATSRTMHREPRFPDGRRQAMKLAWTAAVIVFAAFPATAENVKSSIDQANQTFSAAFAKGDAASVASLYTEQATILPPGAPMMKGRKSIEAFWRQAMSSLKNLKLKAVDVKRFGTAAAREI